MKKENDAAIDILRQEALDKENVAVIFIVRKARNGKRNFLI